uniref:Uncharacterized protein n=1 Tax=Glossina pallidipes TaxID=7398 RepID=A0A1B0AID4_GLOPL
MLLHKRCKPVLLNERSSVFDGDYNDLRLFLCSSCNIQNLKMPQDWCGSVFTSREIMDALKEYKKTVDKNKCAFQIKKETVLLANTPHDLILPDSTQMQLTMIPLDNGSNVIFLLEDQFISVLTNSPLNNLDAFVNNKWLRKALKKGVDVLYIDDSILFESSMDLYHPTEFQLRVLVDLVRPRFVYGLSGFVTIWLPLAAPAAPIG